MSEQPFYVKLASFLPTIKKPEKRLTLRDKLKWTGLVLVLFFAMGSVTVFGIDKESVAQLEFYEILFGSQMGSIITLGIGPIVMASIILQMLVGSKIIPWNLRNKEDKIKFVSAQKLLAIFFSFFEASAYVLSGAVPASTGDLIPLVILQIAIGGIIIIYLDEITTKWGIGSGVSLFIAAGVSKTIIQRIFLPPIELATGEAEGILFSFITKFASGNIVDSLITITPLIATIVVFGIVIFTQAIRVEIPIAFSFAFGRLPSRKWPLKFFYTSNIPVILTAALLVNLRIFAQMLSQQGNYILGRFEGGNPVSGPVYWLSPPQNVILGICVILSIVTGIGVGLLVNKKFKKYVLRSSIISSLIVFTITSILFFTFREYIPMGMFTGKDILRAITYMLAMVIGSTIFSYFWMNTAGMDPKSVSEQFKSSYLSIPGFRRDPRVIERVLERYIPPLTILGGAFVGFLAGFADLTSALGTGTGILLTAMIIMQFYENIAAQHLEDMHPSIRKFIRR